MKLILVGDRFIAHLDEEDIKEISTRIAPPKSTETPYIMEKDYGIAHRWFTVPIKRWIKRIIGRKH